MFCGPIMSEQVKHHLLENLLHKLQQAFSATSLDLDYLEFLCRQELYILEALSYHIQAPPFITQALEELFDLVRAQVYCPAPICQSGSCCHHRTTKSCRNL